MGYPPIPPPSQTDPPTGGMGVGATAARVTVTPMALAPLGEGVGKRMDFRVRSRYPNSEARRAMLMTWLVPSGSGLIASCTIRDYYEDSYLMPLVVSSLTGDASDVFDWIRSLNARRTQDLITLLQMLREHYCGSLTFREQRNTIENLRQKPQEAAIHFLIRVGTSVSNLGNDWKDELTDAELQSLQYEVSLNRVHEEIRHVLDSEIAKNGGNLTPQQIYEAVKRYETYVAHNKRLEGKGASSCTSQPKASGHTSGYKPQFHKTTAFAATIPEVEDDVPDCPESSPQEGADAYGQESLQDGDEGLYIPSYLEEAIPDDPVLQMKMAHTM